MRIIVNANLENIPPNFFHELRKFLESNYGRGRKKLERYKKWILQQLESLPTIVFKEAMRLYTVRGMPDLIDRQT